MPLQPLDEPIVDETLARIVGAVLVCRCPDGSYRWVKADDQGRFVVAGGEGSAGGDVAVTNWPSAFAINNWPTGFVVAGTVGISNFPAFPSSFAVSNFPGTQPVSGTFWQATQPVSIASPVPVTGTFWQSTQPVSGPLTDAQLRASPLPVSGTFWQATQPVSLASQPLPTGASTEATLAAIKAKTDNLDVALSTRAVTGLTDAQLRAAPVPVSAAALPLPTGAATEATVAGIARPSALTATQTGNSGAAVTLTLAAVAGQFHYITHIRIQLYAAAARAGSATPVVVTTTNLPGSLAYTFETAQAIGTSIERVTELAGNPLKSSAVGVATTIVCPVATTGIWRITAHYYAAP